MQGARKRLAVGAGNLHQVLEIAQTQTRLHRDLLAGPGNGDPPVGAVHEAHSEQRLQLLDCDAERGLGDEAGLRRPAKVAMFRERHEVTELAHGGEMDHDTRPALKINAQNRTLR